MDFQQLDVLNCKVSSFSLLSPQLLRSSAQQIAAHPSQAYQPRTRQSSRQRGVVLTEQGWHQLMVAKVLQNFAGEWHTYELLGDRTSLSPRTVSKMIGREVGVDRRTIQQFFEAFDLSLEDSDYSIAN